MTTARTYPKAPITEAIIQLLVEPAPGRTLVDIARAHDAEAQSYPHRKNIQIARGQIQVGAQVSAAASAQHVGFLYTSADERQVYQATLDGFSFSWLAPYESWTPFCEEARRLWTNYRQKLQPTIVTRQAVRYVNRLDIPGGQVDIGDYLRTQPQIAADLPQTLAGYFMQLHIPMEDIKCKLVLNETIGESPQSGCIGLILDIDLFRSDDIPQDEEAIWQLFELLHSRKNEVFEACITERARELFH